MMSEFTITRQTAVHPTGKFPQEVHSGVWFLMESLAECSPQKVDQAQLDDTRVDRENVHEAVRLNNMVKASRYGAFLAHWFQRVGR
jgi:hypothetical protein